MAQTLHLLSSPSPSRTLPSLSPRPIHPFPLIRRRSSSIALPFSASASASASSSASTPPHDIGSPVLASDNGIGGGAASAAAAVAAAAIDVDAVTEAELKENGFRSTRRTKLVCTIFDLNLAVVLAGFAFEAYTSPPENVGWREVDAADCQTVFLSEMVRYGHLASELLIHLFQIAPFM